MSFGYGWRGPNIVKDGLVLYLDPGSPNSYYDKTSTTIKDISGNGLNGALTNNTYSTLGGGNIAFNGSNSVVGLGDNDLFSFTSGGGVDLPFSVSCWVRLTTYGTGGFAYSTFISKSQNITGSNWIREWQFSHSNSSGFGFNLFKSDSTAYIGRSINSALSLNTWYHLTSTYDASKVSTGIKLYINGIEQSTIDVSSGTYLGMTNTSITLELGRQLNTNSDSGYLNGNMSNVLIYRNKVLSAAEVLQNYNALKSRFQPVLYDYESLTYTSTNTITITNNGTNTVNMFKTTGTNAWDSQCYSLTPFTAPCTIEFNKQAGATDNGVSYAMIGWNVDPTTNASYTSLDYASYPYVTNTYNVYHNSTQVLASGTWSTANKFYIVYDTDGFIRHYNGSTLLYSVNYGTGNIVYVDSSIYSVDATFGGFSNVRVRRNSWNGTTYILI